MNVEMLVFANNVAILAACDGHGRVRLSAPGAPSLLGVLRPLIEACPDLAEVILPLEAHRSGLGPSGAM